MIKSAAHPIPLKRDNLFDPLDELNQPSIRDRAAVSVEHWDHSHHVIIHIHRDDRAKPLRKHEFAPPVPEARSISMASLNRIYNLLYGRRWDVRSRKVRDHFEVV